MSWIDGKRIILTGASSGIGRELVRLLVLRHGCRVVGVARSEEKLLSLKNELGASAELFEYALFDVSSKRGWLDFAAGLGEADVLISNAGVMPKIETFESAAKTDFEGRVAQVLDTDFTALLYAVDALLPTLKSSPSPAIIAMSSASSFMGVAGMTVYSAAKAAVRSFMECLGQELRPYGFYTASICPGFAKTSLFREQPEGGFVRIVEFFCMPSDKMARRIMRGIRRRRRTIKPDFESRFMRFCHFFFGKIAMDMTTNLLRRSKIALWEDVFK